MLPVGRSVDDEERTWSAPQESRGRGDSVRQEGQRGEGSLEPGPGSRGRFRARRGRETENLRKGDKRLRRRLLRTRARTGASECASLSVGVGDRRRRVDRLEVDERGSRLSVKARKNSRQRSPRGFSPRNTTRRGGVVISIRVGRSLHGLCMFSTPPRKCPPTLSSRWWMMTAR